MQVYDVLNVLTARPDALALAAADHFLYGHVHPGEDYSTGHWMADVSSLLRRPELQGRTPVFVGGTGLYFRALTGGISQMPDVPGEVRSHWRLRLSEEGPEALHPLLAEIDPEAAARIKPQDGQRIIRAMEIYEASGRPISHWQGMKSSPLVDMDRAERILLLPDRDVLSGRIAHRLSLMAEHGALDEVRELLALDLNPGAAGDEGNWRAGICRACARRNRRRDGIAAGCHFDPPVCQTAVHLVPQPTWAGMAAVVTVLNSGIFSGC